MYFFLLFLLTNKNVILRCLWFLSVHVVLIIVQSMQLHSFLLELNSQLHGIKQCINQSAAVISTHTLGSKNKLTEAGHFPACFQFFIFSDAAKHGLNPVQLFVYRFQAHGNSSKLWLSDSEPLVCSKIGQVFLIGPGNKRPLSPLQPVAPHLECQYQGQELAVTHVIVPLWRKNASTEEGTLVELSALGAPLG